MYYVCDEHEVAFEKEPQARAHWNFQHEKGDTWITVDKDSVMQEEVPEGYLLRDIASVRAREKAAAGQREQSRPDRAERVVATPPTPRPNVLSDPEAERLYKMLTSIGVPDNEVNRIVNGFVNIPIIKSDPNYLSHWLDTHIRADRALKAYIPMVVQEVLGQSASSAPLPGIPFDGTGAARYIAPQYPYSFTGNPYGFTGMPNAPYFTPPQDPESTKRITDLGNKFEALLGMIQEDRQSREQERREREQREHDQQINSRIEKLQDTIVEFVKASSSGNKSALEQKTETQIDALMSEIKDLRSDHQTQALKAVLEEVVSLRQAVAANRGEQVGRTTEDLVHALGPAALDKFDKAGERIQTELKGLREQMGPSLKESVERAARGPRTTEQIEDQVETENRIISLTEEPEDIDVIVEGAGAEEAVAVAAEEQPYARMPNPARRRRSRNQTHETQEQEDKEGDEVS